VRFFQNGAAIRNHVELHLPGEAGSNLYTPSQAPRGPRKDSRKQNWWGRPGRILLARKNKKLSLMECARNREILNGYQRVTGIGRGNLNRRGRGDSYVLLKGVTSTLIRRIGATGEQHLCRILFPLGHDGF